MATPSMAYGERQFGAAYTVPIFLTLAGIFFIAGLWMARTNAQGESRPILIWVSLRVMVAIAALWIALGKFALIVNDAGVRRESPFGQQELAWSQIVETLRSGAHRSEICSRIERGRCQIH